MPESTPTRIPELTLGTRQRPGRLELLGLLQGFLCHFFLPLNLPLWGDAILYAIGAPLPTTSLHSVSVVECAIFPPAS